MRNFDNTKVLLHKTDNSFLIAKSASVGSFYSNINYYSLAKCSSVTKHVYSDN